MVRHYCDECGSRVFPYDKYEKLTEAPQGIGLGPKQNQYRKAPVLLTSHNQSDPDNRRAWCWACDKWVLARRLLESEFLKLYLARKGVTVRPFVPKKRRKA